MYRKPVLAEVGQISTIVLGTPGQGPDPLDKELPEGFVANLDE